MNILLTAVTGPSGICFAKSLQNVQGVRLIGASADNSEISDSLLDAVYRVPLANDPTYLEVLRDIVERERIDYCIPLVDEEVIVLSAPSAHIGCRILVSPRETTEYTNDKSKAYEVLGAYLPLRFTPDSIPRFPVFAKPRVGRGGKGSMVITHHKQLSIVSADTYIFQELLEGPEVSVDVLFDFNGTLVVAVPRVRSVVEQGISISGEVFSDDTLMRSVQEIAQLLRFVGPVNFQYMRLRGEYKLIEINARGSGGMGITIHSGVDIPKLSYEMMSRGTVSKIPAARTGFYLNFEEVIKRQRQRKLQ